MDIVIGALVAVGITALGMIGGQCNKWTRRYVLPSLIAGYTAWKKKDKRSKLKAISYLPLMGVLSMGYGQNSKLRKFLGGSDVATRIVYGLLVSIPFVILGKWWACIALPIAWSIRAGGFQIIPTKDWLWEDFIRYGTIGILVVL